MKNRRKLLTSFWINQVSISFGQKCNDIRSHKINSWLTFSPSFVYQYQRNGHVNLTIDDTVVIPMMSFCFSGISHWIERPYTFSCDENDEQETVKMTWKRAMNSKWEARERKKKKKKMMGCRLQFEWLHIYWENRASQSRASSLSSGVWSIHNRSTKCNVIFDINRMGYA